MMQIRQKKPRWRFFMDGAGINLTPDLPEPQYPILRSTTAAPVFGAAVRL